MPRRKRNTSPHRGCWLEKPRGTVGWRACWVEPASGKTKKVTLSRAGYPDAAARSAFAKTKADALVAQRLATPTGVIAVLLGDAMREHFEAHAGALRKRTLDGYKHAGALFVAWCAEQEPPVRFTREITKSVLARFRAARINKPRDRNPDAIRSAVSINNELRALKTVLSAWVDDHGEWLAISRDAIRAALRRLPTEQNEIVFLKPHRCRALLRAWLALDLETFAMTRAEKEARRPPGRTPRYARMAPFVAVMLLTGMRKAEGLAVTWTDVDLEARTIAIKAQTTKTRVARVFEMSPALHLILNGMWLALAHPLREGRAGRVFPELTADGIEAARKRLAKREKGRDAMDKLLAHVSESDAGVWSWQLLRRTCATTLCNMPSVGPWVEAKALGHSVTISERLYSGRLKVPATATTIEAAMGIEKEVIAIARRVS